MRSGLPKFYVYEIWDPLTQKCRYVGKGQGSRATNQVVEDKQRNPKLKRFLAECAAQSVEIAPKIVYRHNIEADVLRKERALIARYGREGVEQGGTLFNITSGGQGIFGRGTAVEIAGILYSTIKEAAEAYGVNESTLRRRLSKGIKPEQAVGLESRHRTHPNAKATVVNGITYKSQAHACKELGVTQSAVMARLKRGWSIEEAFGIVDRPWAQNRRVSINGESFESIRSASEGYGIDPETALARLARGWSTEEAFGVKRRRRGDRRFDEHEVRDIRARVASGQQQRQIAIYYGVDPSTISRICRGEAYARTMGGALAAKKVHAPRLRKERVEAIRNARAGGKSNSTIAKQFGLDVSAVSRICTGKSYADAGGPIQRAQRRVSQEEIAEISRRHRFGESFTHIAETLGLHTETVRRICKAGRQKR